MFNIGSYTVENNSMKQNETHFGRSQRLHSLLTYSLIGVIVFLTLLILIIGLILFSIYRCVSILKTTYQRLAF